MPRKLPNPEHWTERAERVGPSHSRWLGDNDEPIFGLVGEDPNGDLLLPAWFKGNWWNRPLNLRRPIHWLPYLRSRLSRKLAWLDDV